MMAPRGPGGERYGSRMALHPGKPLAPAQVLTLLTDTPLRLEAVTTGVAPARFHTAPVDGEWSANEVLAHMRSCADVWGDCIATMIAEDRPTIRAVNPRTWIKTTNYRELKFRPSLRAFTTQRAELVALLETLPRRGWSRAASVTGAGAVLERTVREYAQWLAQHERAHVKQIARAVGG